MAHLLPVLLNGEPHPYPRAISLDLEQNQNNKMKGSRLHLGSFTCRGTLGLWLSHQCQSRALTGAQVGYNEVSCTLSVNVAALGETHLLATQVLVALLC